MRKRATIVAAAVVVTALMAGIGKADPPDPNNGATKPVREQNLDGNGWIAVHEQGVADVNVQNSNLNVTLQNEELDVNVTNDSLPVEGEVSVSNFPSTQNVNVTGGSVANAPVTELSQLFFNVEPDESDTQTFDAIAVSSIVMVTGDHEWELHGSSPLTGSELFIGYDPSGDDQTRTYEFPNPIPLDGLTLHCANESDLCVIQILLAGF
ncbi:MAG: hypothetical protein ACRDH9_06520 [Actinomycetota bacterium]